MLIGWRNNIDRESLRVEQHKRSRWEYPNATYMYWSNLIVLFEPKIMPSFFGRQKLKHLSTL